MPNSGFSPIPARDSALLTSEAAREQNRLVTEWRERFAAKYPDVKFSTRRENERLLFEVSEPGRASWATDDAVAMMEQLKAMYPDE